MSFPREKFPLNQPQQMFIKRFLRKIFLEDWLVKLIALVITLTLWLGVSGLRAPITTRLNNIALQPRVSSNMEITNSPATEVALVITGDKRKLDQIRTENLVVSFDLTTEKPDDIIVQLTPENVNVELPTGVRLEEIQPNRIAVKLETVEEREIPVKAETEGAVGSDAEIYSVAVLPQKVRVRGPSGYIKSLDFVPTEKIDLENRTADFTVNQIPLNLSNPKATVLDTAVNVVFRIGEKRIEKAFTISAKNGSGVKKVSFKLFGAQSLLSGISAEKLHAELSENEAGEETFQVITPPELNGRVEVRDQKIIN